DTKQTLFTVTGILMIITFAMSIAVVGALFATFGAIFTAIPGTTRPPTEVLPPEFLKKMLAFAGIYVAIVVAAAAVGLASLIAEIASHFRASGIFQNTWFKVGGWLRIATIIVAVIAIPIIIFTAMRIPGALKGVLPSMMAKNVFMLFTSILWPMLIAMILGLLATVFSIVAFFTIPEETET
ncbi:MAG: hypothetical protein DRN60_04170, partial [Thaumarchaeota archaeon]